MKVLVIDDVEAIRDAVCLLLEMEGFEAVGASGAIEGVAQALRCRPSVVVLDHNMPGYDGGRTAVMLRALVPEARIVAFSAVLDGRPAWADEFLAKQDIVGLTGLLDSMEPSSS